MAKEPDFDDFPCERSDAKESTSVAQMIVLIICFVGLIFGFAMLVSREIEKRKQRIRDEGANARREGVNPEANPYEQETGALWLQGWIDQPKHEPRLLQNANTNRPVAPQSGWSPLNEFRVGN